MNLGELKAALAKLDAPDDTRVAVQTDDGEGTTTKWLRQVTFSGGLCKRAPEGYWLPIVHLSDTENDDETPMDHWTDEGPHCPVSHSGMCVSTPECTEGCKHRDSSPLAGDPTKEGNGT